MNSLKSFFLLIYLSATCFSHAATPTVTALVITPSDALAAQQIITLIATVQSAGQPVSIGTIEFYDGKLYLGSEQVVRDASHGYAVGTATKKMALSIGTHSIVATFLPTATLASSTSATQTVTVSSSGSPIRPGTTNLMLTDAATSSNQILTATLSVSGVDMPTGSVLFSNQTNNIRLGTVAVNPSSFKAGFSPALSFATKIAYPAMYSSDFNGDGLPDVLCECNVLNAANGNWLQPFLNGGDGTFRAVAPILTPLPFVGTPPVSSEQQISQILEGDFNGDGVPDLVFQSSATMISVLLGAGDGTFPFTETLFPPSGGSNSYFESIAIGDFNGDGIPDLMAINFVYTSTVSVAVNIFPGKGDGTFSAPTSSTGVAGNPSVIRDFNQDGFADLAMTSSSQNAVLIQLGKEDGSFQPPTSYPVGTNPVMATILQSHGNGITDLAVWNQGSGNDYSGGDTFGILMGRGDGTFFPQVTYPYQPGANHVLLQAIAADVTGDGLQDMVVMFYPSPFDPYPYPQQTFSIFAGNGDGTYQAPATYNFLPNTRISDPLTLTAADFNHDGIADIGVLDLTNEMFEALSISLQGNPLFTANIPFTTPVYGTGIQQLVATYSGDSNYVSSTSSAISVTEQGPAPTPTFTLASNPSSLSITAGKTGTATLSVTPQNGFNKVVTFSCSGLPANSSCGFSPSSVTPNGAAVTTTLTLATDVQVAANPIPGNAFRGAILSFALLLGFVPFAGIRFAKGRGLSPTLNRSAIFLFSIGLAALASTLVLGCSGSGSSGSTPPPTSPTTPIGTSNITVKAIESGSSGTSPSIVLTVAITN